MKKTLLTRFHSSSPEVQKAGVLWYRKAFRFCKEVSSSTEVPLANVVGVLAALSPHNNWEQNKKDTIRFIETNGAASVCTFGKNKEKALDILFFCFSEREILRVLRGPKTSAFFLNLLHPLTNGRVTLDRWALRAAGLDSNKTLRKGERSETELAYQEAAAEMGLRVHEFQAAIWESIRAESASK